MLLLPLFLSLLSWEGLLLVRSHFQTSWVGLSSSTAHWWDPGCVHESLWAWVLPLEVWDWDSTSLHCIKMRVMSVKPWAQGEVRSTWTITDRYPPPRPLPHLKFTINVIAIVFYNFKSFLQHKFQIAWQGLNIIAKAPSIFRSFLRIVTVKNNNISLYFDGIL